MSEPRKAIGSMHFGPFELSPELSELRKHGQRLKLSGQAIDVLLMLASNAGRLVTREELQRKLWPGDSFGDFEHGLNAAVNRLREDSRRFGHRPNLHRDDSTPWLPLHRSGRSSAQYKGPDCTRQYGGAASSARCRRPRRPEGAEAGYGLQ